MFNSNVIDWVRWRNLSHFGYSIHSIKSKKTYKIETKTSLTKSKILLSTLGGNTCLRIGDQNGHLPISSKTSNKMPLFWNNLVICPCFKTRFFKNRVSMKNLIFRKSSYRQKIKKKKEKLHGAWVPCNILQVTRFSLNLVFYLNLILKKNWVSKQGYFIR